MSVEKLLDKVNKDRKSQGQQPALLAAWNLLLSGSDRDCLEAAAGDLDDKQLYADVKSLLSRTERHFKAGAKELRGKRRGLRAGEVCRPITPLDYEWQRARALSEQLALEVERIEPNPSALRHGCIAAEFNPRVFRETFLGGKWLNEHAARVFCNSPALSWLSPEHFHHLGIPFLAHRVENTDALSPVSKHQTAGSVTLSIAWEGGSTEIEHQAQRSYPGPEYFVAREPRHGELPVVTIPFSDDAQHHRDTGSEEGWSLPTPREKPVWDGSVLWVLWKLVERLRFSFPWDDAAEITWFVLTGAAPQIHPLSWQIDAEHPFAREKFVRLTVAPWVRAATIQRAYREIQRTLIGKENCPYQARGLALVQFVAERKRREPKVKWAELRRDWNSWVNDASWRFEEGTEQRMMTEYGRLRDAITRPNYRDQDYWKRPVEPTSGKGAPDER